MTETDSRIVQARGYLSEPRRQSPLMLVVSIIEIVKSSQVSYLGLIAVFFFLRNLAAPILFLVTAAVLLLVIQAALQWWKFTFWVAGDELIVSKGVFSTKRLTIPMDRVQSISVDQPFLQRLLRLVAVSIETAGGLEAEVKIESVSESVARAIQDVVAEYGLADQTEGTDVGHVASPHEVTSQDAISQQSNIAQVDNPRTLPGKPSEEELIRRTPKELFKVAVSRFRPEVFGLFAAVIGLGEAVEDWTIWERLSHPVLIWFGIVLFLILLVVGTVARVVVVNWDLTLVRSGAGLRRTAGLLSRTGTSTTLDRVQAVVATQNIVERWLKIRRIALPTIGSGDVRLPGSNQNDIAKIRGLLFGSGAVPQPQRTISPWIIYRDVRSLVFPVGGLVVAGVLASNWFYLGAVAVAIAGGIAAYVRWRFLRWNVDAHQVVVSQVGVAQTVRQQDIIKVQSVGIQRSWLERRRNLATLQLVFSEDTLTIPMVDFDEAQRARDLVLAVVETDRRPWM